MKCNYLLILVITMPFVRAMERVQKDQDCLFHLNQQLAMVYQWNIQKIKPTLKNFSWVNRDLRTYYTQEKTGQQIIRMLALHNNISDFDCAKLLGHKIIAQKIEQFFGTPPHYNLNFCLNDLKKSWYLNVTSSFSVVEVPQTLLHRAIEFIDLEKVQTVLAAGIVLLHPQCENPLQLVLRRYFCAHDHKEKARFFSIAELLLEEKLKSDEVRVSMEKQSITPLMKAVACGDQKLTRLLLEYGASPYEAIIKEGFLVNCFGMERGQPKGWLMAMHKEIQSQSTF